MVWGSNPGDTRFSAHVQIVSGAHTASYAMIIRSLYRGQSGRGGGVNHLPAKVKEKVELHLCAFVACSRVNFNFYLYPFLPKLRNGWKVFLFLRNTS